MTGKTEETCASANAHARFKVAHIMTVSDQAKWTNADE